MQIIWHGQSCFEIITTPAKNSPVRIIIDPFSEEVGLKFPKIEADILLVSHERYNQTIRAVLGEPFLIETPGEYEIKNIFIQGISSYPAGENTIYIIDAEQMRLCHLGGLKQKELTEEQLEKIGEIDILTIPVGGGSAISGKEALKIMSQIEPKITLPMHYHIPKLKEKLDGLDNFLKSLGIKSIEPMNKLTIKKKDIPTDEAKIIVLKP